MSIKFCTALRLISKIVHDVASNPSLREIAYKRYASQIDKLKLEKEYSKLNNISDQV